MKKLWLFVVTLALLIGSMSACDEGMAGRDTDSTTDSIYKDKCPPHGATGLLLTNKHWDSEKLLCKKGYQCVEAECEEWQECNMPDKKGYRCE